MGTVNVRRLGILSLAALGLAATAGVARAADPKSYAAAACQRVAGSLVYETNGRVRNPATVPAAVVCPLVRDDLSAVNPAWLAANMTVIDNNAFAGFYCTAQSRNINGTAAFFSVAGTTAAFVGTATIAFPSVGKMANGYYVIDCRMPQISPTGAQSYIASYRLVEPLPSEP